MNPPNDLDLETLDLMQEKIAEYEGTVILVSHDRDFLDRICTSIIAHENGGKWSQYAGGYSDMIAQRGHEVRAVKSKTGKKSVKKNDQISDLQRASNKKVKPAQLSFTQMHRLETLPKEIERLEFEIGKLKIALGGPDLYAREPKKFERFVKALGEREKTLVEKESLWLELEELREADGD